MLSLTPTPETHLLFATVALASLSPTALTERLSDVAPRLRRFRRESTYVAVLLAVAVAGLLVVEPPLVFDPPGWRAVAALVAGLPAGALAFHADQTILRAHRRRRQLDAMRSRTRFLQSSSAGTSVRGGPSFPSGWRLPVIGALEEVIFRGVLFSLALANDNPWVAGGLVVAVTLVFAANHVPYGNVHVLAKLPLSIVTGAVTLLGGSMGGAAVAHAWFNHRIGLEAGRAAKAVR